MTDDKKKLLVQLSHDGFYCYSDAGASGNCVFTPSREQEMAQAMQGNEFFKDDYHRVDVVIDTLKTVLVPGSFLADDASYIENSGIMLTPDETEVQGMKAKGINSVMACRRDVADFLVSSFANVNYYSPLQVNIMRSPRNTIYINLTDRAYLTFVDDSLRYAEVFPMSGAEDILFYALDVRERMGVRNASVIVAGFNSLTVSGLLRNSFGKVVCDDLEVKADAMSRASFNLLNLL